jgi:hypothetical protein
LGGEENGDLNLTKPAAGNPVITIIGAGADSTVIDGNQLDRVMNIDSNRTTSISGVTIRNGYLLNGDGGGIQNYGNLTVHHCTISGNRTVNGRGGGIYNGVSLTVADCTISSNQAVGGGGLYNNGSGGTQVEVDNSTIDNNGATGGGGGIYNAYPLTVSRSTISGNQTGGDGGGIFNGDSFTLINTTISRNDANGNGGGHCNDGAAVAVVNLFNATIALNDADANADPLGGSGGGFYNYPNGTINLRNTLVTGNYVHNAPVYDDCTGTLNSYGRNLFWQVVGCTINTVSGNWGYLNDRLTIGPLQDNGGPTWTHALLPGSNAIDGGDPVQGCIGTDALPLPTDQRGGGRVTGANCDVGAFEYGAHIGQSIQFGPISNKKLTDSPFVITATSSSGLPVDFSTNTPSICTLTSGPLIAGVSSATVVLSRGGTCTLVAQQPGNQIFDPAIAVTQTFNVTGSTFLPLILR